MVFHESYPHFFCSHPGKGTTASTYAAGAGAVTTEVVSRALAIEKERKQQARLLELDGPTRKKEFDCLSRLLVDVTS